MFQQMMMHFGTSVTAIQGNWVGPSSDNLTAINRLTTGGALTIEEAAKQTIYGGLLASGWHTGSLMMRLLWDGLLKDTVSLGSPGIDEMRWVRPVRPGDTLSARLTVLECIPSRSKRDRGIIKSLVELRNQRGEVVVTIKGLSLLGRRPA